MPVEDKSPEDPSAQGFEGNEGANLEPDQSAPEEAWDWDARSQKNNSVLHIDVEGFEGPLDLLLSLARTQKVDITKISIMALADQYLNFVAKVRVLHLELAADYLVMAAWLAYLKSKLLLPDEAEGDEPSGEELAALLAFRLKRLEAMREAAAQLMARDRLGRDIFARGDPEYIVIDAKGEYCDNLFDLLQAYTKRRERLVVTDFHIPKLPVMQINEARHNLERLLGQMVDWGAMELFLDQFIGETGDIKSVKASSFSASLEMAREGIIELRQEKVFSPIFMRSKLQRPDEHMDKQANG